MDKLDIKSSWNKGIKTSEEHKKKISNSMKGRIPWNKGLSKDTNNIVKMLALKREGTKNPHYPKGPNNHRFGVKHRTETIDKMKKNHSKFWEGKTFSSEHTLKMSVSGKRGWGKEERLEVSQRFKSKWKDPIYRQKILFGIKNGPKKNTSIEIILRKWLLENKISFKEQYIINETHCYTIVDFFIEPNICLYADGDYWHNLPTSKKKDDKINLELPKLGYKIIRLWEHEIKAGKRPIELLNKERI